MCNFYDQFTNFAAPKGLYRVWVRADDREGVPLVARWIDPRKENGSEAEDKNVHICEEICLGGESAECEVDPALHLAFAGAF
jgi:hypothetical protein